TNYTGSPGGSYLLQIDGPSVAPAPPPTPVPPPGGDDAYEDNDTSYSAANLGTLSAYTRLNNLVMADGHDWYRFQMNAAAPSGSYVAVNFTHALGDIDMELFNGQ